MTSKTFETNQGDRGFRVGEGPRHNTFKRQAGFAGRKILLVAMVVGGMFLAGCSKGEKENPTEPDGPVLLQYAHDSFFAAVIVHPSRVMDSPLLKKMPLGMFLDSPEYKLPVKPGDIEEFVLFINLPKSASGMASENNFGLVISLSKAIETQELLDSLPRKPKKEDIGEATHDGKTFVTYTPSPSTDSGKGKQPDTPAQMGIYRPDDKTLVVAEVGMLKKMLSASSSDTKSLLAQKLASLDLNDDLAIVVSIEQEREAIMKMWGMLAFFLPEAVSDLPEKLNTITITADLTSGSLLNVAVEGSSEEAATEIEKKLGVLKPVLEGGFSQFKQSEPKPGDPKLSPEMLAVAEKVIQSLSVIRDGSTIVVDVKNPGSLDQFSKLIFGEIMKAAMKDSFGPPRGPGPGPGSSQGGNSEKSAEKIGEKEEEEVEVKKSE